MTEQAFFAGLQPFDTAQAAHLSGQQTLAQDIYATWRHQGEHGRTFLALLGAPNSGKSSLLRAGVLPLLAEDSGLDTRDWRQAVWYPSDDRQEPLRGLAAALLKALPELEQQQQMHIEQLATLLKDHPKAVVLLLKTTLDLLAKMPIQADEDAPVARLVLLIENLEHLLLPSLSVAQRELLCERLATLASSGRCWILASLEESALQAMSGCAQFAKLLSGTGQYRLQPPQAAQWQGILQAGLSQQAVDAGLYTQVFHAVQQQPYPLSALQAVFKLARQGLDWAAMGGLSGALACLLRLELADFSAQERAAVRDILSQFALHSETQECYTCRQPAAQLERNEIQREVLKRLLDKQLLWREQQGDTLWIGANAVVLHTLQMVGDNVVDSTPRATPAKAVEKSDKVAFKRYFAGRPAVLMVLGLGLIAALVFFPHYKDWATQQIARGDRQDTPPPSIATPPADTRRTAQLDAPIDAPPKSPLDSTTPPTVIAPAAVSILEPPKPKVRPQTDTSPARLDELAAAQEKQKHWAKALALYEQALHLRLNLRSSDSSDKGLLSELSRNYDRIAALQQQLEQPKAALLSYHEALSVSHKLYTLEPDNVLNQRDLAISYQRVGDWHSAEKEYEQARHHYQDALKYFQQAVDTEKTRRNQRALAGTYDKLGDLLVLQNDTKTALSSYQSALSVRLTLLQHYPDQSSQQEVMYSHSKINSLWQRTR